MRLITSAADFAGALEAERGAGRCVGLVPTMGALHAGHRALLDRAVAECDTVAVSVFVNPLQFGDAADLDAYPRTLEHDLEVTRDAGAGVVFAPPVTEMYPGFPVVPSVTVHVGDLGAALEGAARPGHFDGVATVVAKLFALAGRCRAYFGEKDFQQLMVVRLLVSELMLPVEVRSVPTVREHDGLALSSRNVRLSCEDRRAATVLHRALIAGMEVMGRGERAPRRVRDAMMAVMSSERRVRPDYAEAVEATTLRVPAELRGEVRLLVAATVGPVRLIDNEGAVITAAGVQVRPGAALGSAGSDRRSPREAASPAQGRGAAGAA